MVGDSHSYDLFHALACFLIQLYDHNYNQEYPYAAEVEAFNHLEQHVEHYKPPECLPLQEDTMLCQIRVNRGQVIAHTVTASLMHCYSLKGFFPAKLVPIAFRCACELAASSRCPWIYPDLKSNFQKLEECRCAAPFARPEADLMMHWEQMMREHALPMLQRMGKPSDIAVVNFAHWHNGWEGHEYRDLLQAFRASVAAHADALPHIVWKQMVPTHYKHLHGAYKGGTPPFECGPLGANIQPDGSLVPVDELSALIVEGGAHNKAAMEVFAGSDIVMTHSWNATVELHEYHRDLADGRGHECGGRSLPECHIALKSVIHQRCFKPGKKGILTTLSLALVHMQKWRAAFKAWSVTCFTVFCRSLLLSRGARDVGVLRV